MWSCLFNDAGKNSIKIEERINIGVYLVKAAIAIQAAGLVHGDLKPSNIMVMMRNHKLVSAKGREPVVVIDFSQCREMRHGQQFISGTPGFTAPEQTDADRCRTTDNYNIGQLLAMLLMEWSSCWAAFFSPCSRRRLAELRKSFKTKFQRKAINTISALLEVLF